MKLNIVLTLILFFVSLSAKITVPNLEWIVTKDEITAGENFSLLFFSCNTCKIKLASPLKEKPRPVELSPGLFLTSTDNKKMNIEGQLKDVLVINFHAFNIKTSELPAIGVIIEEGNDIHSLEFPGTKIEIFSNSNVNKWAPFLNPFLTLKTSTIFKQLIWIAALLIVLFLLILFLKKKTKPRPKTIKYNPEFDLKKQISAIKTSKEHDIKALYTELSTCFNSWLEFKFKVNAHKLLPVQLVKAVKASMESENAHDSVKLKEKINVLDKTLRRLHHPKFISKGQEIKQLHDTVDTILRWINEF